MPCSKCKTQNSDDAVFCKNCGNKLKIVCPKCKTANKTDAANCKNCNLKLIRFCPVCSFANNPLSLECQSCKTPLLKRCPQCNAINLIKSQNCKKCSFKFKNEDTNFKPYPILRIDLANANFYTNQIPKKEVGEKLLRKFFQSILKIAKPRGLKVLKISSSAAAIELKDTDATSSLEVAFAIFRHLNVVNASLAKFKAEYEYKVFVFEALSSNHNFAQSIINKVATKCICCDEKIMSPAEHMFPFEELSENIFKMIVPPMPSEEAQKATPKPSKKLLKKPVKQAEATKSITPEEPKTEPAAQAPSKQNEPPAPEPTANAEVLKVETPTQTEEPKVEPKVESNKEVAPDTDELSAQQEQIAETPVETPLEVATPENPVSQDSPPVSEANTTVEQETKVNEPKIQPQTPATAVQEESVAPAQIESPRAKANNTIKSAIKNMQGGFIHMAGISGIGKSTFLNQVFGELKDQNLCILQADCHISNHNNHFATIQSMIRSMFSLPVTNVDNSQVVAHVEKILRENIHVQDEEVITYLLMLLAPKTTQANILVSRDKMVHAIKDLFKKIKQLQKVLILVEEIEFLDLASAEIFDELISEGFLNDAFMIATTSSDTFPAMIFQADNLAEKTILNIVLDPLTPDELEESLAYYIHNKEDLPPALHQQIQVKTQGWPMFLEETILFLTQAGIISPDESGNVKVKSNAQNLTLPTELEELITVRIEKLFEIHENIHQVLAHAVCLGYSFFPPVLQESVGMKDDEFNQALHTLMISGLCHSPDGVNFKFKNKFLFELIRTLVIQNEEEYAQVNENIFNALVKFPESNSSQIAQSAQNAGDYKNALKFWSEAAKECLATGDNYLHLLCQKNVLNNIEYSTSPYIEEEKLALYENLGVANYQKSPEDAIDFLSKAIKHYEEEHDCAKIIYLSGYLVKSLQVTGNFQEAMGYIEKSIDCLSLTDDAIEIALLKFLKLKLLLEVGNLGEIIPLIQSEILPTLHKGIKTNLSPEKMENISDAILQTQIILLKTLALQGHKNYFNTLKAFVEGIEITDNEADVFIVDALYKMLNGLPKESEASIKKTKSILKTSKHPKKDNMLLEMEFISLLNEFFYSDRPNISMKVGAIAQKTKKLSNSMIYNGLQLAFAKQLANSRELTGAANLVNDCLTYFSEQKIALFAIPSWTILAEVQLTCQDYDQAISIAQQALGVSTKPQIQNNYATIHIKKILSDAYLGKGDTYMAQIHLEEGIKIAKEHELHFWEGKMYLYLAEFHSKMAAQEDSKNNLQTAKDYITAAREIAGNISSIYLDKRATKILAKIG